MKVRMNILSKYIKGDKYLWAFIFILVLFSFLPVYSASSNLVHTVGSGTVFSHMGKHAAFLIIGIGIMIAFQKVDYKYFGGIALLAMPVIAVLLRSEEHTSELHSRGHIVCRLLLVKK